MANQSSSGDQFNAQPPRQVNGAAGLPYPDAPVNLDGAAVPSGKQLNFVAATFVWQCRTLERDAALVASVFGAGGSHNNVLRLLQATLERVLAAQETLARARSAVEAAVMRAALPAPLTPQERELTVGAIATALEFEREMRFTRELLELLRDGRPVAGKWPEAAALAQRTNLGMENLLREALAVLKEPQPEAGLLSTP